MTADRDGAHQGWFGLGAENGTAKVAVLLATADRGAGHDLLGMGCCINFRGCRQKRWKEKGGWPSGCP